MAGLWVSKTAEEQAELNKKIFAGFQHLDDTLAKRKTTFFRSNERPKMIDYKIWPW